ncbi:MAG: ATP-binding protein [Cytophagia bacterium]|nr:MAG: ATP-binding protein [Runella sp.]TAG18462.1 MAG: ATP-binding protein [Cytophagales bacterium]TAG39034.1 MAG: ATP-binding protein [Cytophagia bacterium]TAG51413.1 MAG: ATP-binding protein [Runella slithyformis]TAG80550.1 MAG: ATP-binding protein [Cytophagales bacterium]
MHTICKYNNEIYQNFFVRFYKIALYYCDACAASIRVCVIVLQFNTKSIIFILSEKITYIAQIFYKTMLITFTISNFLSFDAPITFSMAAGQVETLPQQVIKGEKRSDVSLLKSAVIYGANASGKSNFIKAVSFAKEVIVAGLDKTITDNKHFRLDTTNKFKPTQFEFEFKYKEKMYAYGVILSLSERKIKEEWLFEILKTTHKPVFERTVKEDGTSRVDIFLKLDKDGQKRFEVYKEDIKATQLFLTEINDKNISNIQNIDPFKNAFEWFKERLIIVLPITKYLGINYVGNEEDSKNAFRYFLQLFGTGVEGVETIEQDLEDQLLSHIKEESLIDLQNGKVRDIILGLGRDLFSISKNKGGLIKVFKLAMQHKQRNTQNLIAFELEDESDGTQRLMDLIPVLVGLTQPHQTYLIDEIDRSLHPELTRKLLETFFENTKGTPSQLIITTHESSLLDLSLIRRDEIWFVEKDADGASHMYSLEEFKPRLDKEVRRAYLQGRFGAIPFIGDVKDLGWLKEITTASVVR